MAPKLTENRRRVLELAARHGCRDVRVFGSSARGTAGPGSDIDVLVELEPGRSLLDLVALKQDLEELLGVAVDVVTRDSVSPYIRQEVLAGAVPL